jgi:hypothetical protein
MGKKEIPIQEKVLVIERDGRKIRQHLFQRGRILRISEEPADGDGPIDYRRKSYRRELKSLRDRAQAVFYSQQSPHNPASMREFIIDAMSEKSIAGELCVIIDRMLEKENGIDLALAYKFAISMNDFLNVLGPNDIFAEGAKMVEGRGLGPTARSAQSDHAKATVRQAANDLKEIAPVFFSSPGRAAKEMLRRGKSGEPGGVREEEIAKSTLRGYIGDLCGTGQSRT